MIDRAVILSTGDELTRGRVADTNFFTAIADRLSFGPKTTSAAREGGRSRGRIAASAAAWIH
jgi:hypothetical protein